MGGERARGVAFGILDSTLDQNFNYNSIVDEDNSEGEFVLTTSVNANDDTLEKVKTQEKEELTEKTEEIVEKEKKMAETSEDSTMAERK